MNQTRHEKFYTVIWILFYIFISIYTQYRTQIYINSLHAPQLPPAPMTKLNSQSCFCMYLDTCLGFPGDSLVKNPPANAGDSRDAGSIPGSGTSSWRRAWQPTPVFLPGESHGQKNLVGYSPWRHKESDTTEQLSTHTDACLRKTWRGDPLKCRLWLFPDEIMEALLWIFKMPFQKLMHLGVYILKHIFEEKTT